MSGPNALHLLADALLADAQDLPADAALGVTPGWDSLGHVRLVLALEAHLARPLTPDEIVALGSLADIEALLQRQP